ncbi:hypothetical protein PAPYR_4328 [Paratrimastix pyriformis]|uniref:Uncharacterized protein n=1 Tax=Paratrimastix pyriformis TaxID=342808 RepID=A0ABQ8UK50_9EUKA|nr:hypothetical protein PAPYR_4328 [Paratrimastix pyriformis]
MEEVPYHFADDCFILFLNRRFWRLTSFWHRFDLTPLPCCVKLTPEAFTQLMTRCPYVSYINLDIQKMLSRRVNSRDKVDGMLAAIHRLCPCLRQLDLGMATPGSFEPFAKIATLTSLYLNLNSTGFRIPERSLRQLTGAPLLTTLTLQDCDLTGYNQFDTPLSRTGSATPKMEAFAEALSKMVPNLSSLSLLRGQCDVRYVDAFVRRFRGQLRRLSLCGLILTFEGRPQPLSSRDGGVAAGRLFASFFTGCTPAFVLERLEELDLGSTRITDEVLQRVGFLCPSLRRLSLFGCSMLGPATLLELRGHPFAQTLEWLNFSAPAYHEVRACLSMGLLRRTVPHDEALPPPGCDYAFLISCPRLRRIIVPPHWLDSTPRKWDEDAAKPMPPVEPFVPAEAETGHRELVLNQFPRVQFICSAEADAV